MLSDEEDDLLAAYASLLAIKKSEQMRKKRRRRNRTMWVKPWIETRLSMGIYHTLLQELNQTDTDSYRNFLRMDNASFSVLVQKVRPYIARNETRLRLSIPPEERLALTLRWLASG